MARPLESLTHRDLAKQLRDLKILSRSTALTEINIPVVQFCEIVVEAAIRLDHILEMQEISVTTADGKTERWVAKVTSPRPERIEGALQAVVQWAEDLGLFAEPATQMAPVFQKAKEALRDD